MRHFRGGHNLTAWEQFVIARSKDGAIVVPSVKIRQLDRQDPALNAFESQVVGRKIVFVLLHRTMVAEHANLFRKFRVVGGDGTTFTAGPEILAGIETEASRSGQGTGRAAVVVCAVRLARVFDYGEFVLRSDGVDGVHVGGLSEGIS